MHVASIRLDFHKESMEYTEGNLITRVWTFCHSWSDLARARENVDRHVPIALKHLSVKRDKVSHVSYPFTAIYC